MVFVISSFLTLAPHDYATYYQARGLSGHTSPCGECVCFHLEAMLGDWLSAQLVFVISLFLTLAPHDYVTYYQAQGLSGHTLPRGECVCFILEDSTPLEAKEDYLPFSWPDSKWAHLVHSEKIFDFELELLTSFWQALLGILCSVMVHNCSATH